MLYRFAQFVNASYGFIVAWAYIVAFLLALTLIFIFPPGTLLLFFIGLASLGVAAAMGKVVDRLTRGLAHRAMRAGHCPRCGNVRITSAASSQAWSCSVCNSAFAADGGETVGREREHFIEQPPDEVDLPRSVLDVDLAGDWRGR